MKFIFHNHPGFTFGRKTSDAAADALSQSTRSLSSDSLPSVASYEPDATCSGVEPLRDTRSRHVRFDVARVVAHANTQMHREEVHELWYTREDIRNMRHRAVREAQRLAVDEHFAGDDDAARAGMAALFDTYQALCHVTTAEDVLSVLAGRSNDTSVQIRSAMVGLDRWAIRPLFQDKVDRRKRILRQTQWIQKNLKADDEEDEFFRWKKIRQISRMVSQPSRLYSQHVAQMQARASLD